MGQRNVTTSFAFKEFWERRGEMLNYDRYYSNVEMDAESYKNAEPFPNIVLDQFLDDEVYLAISNEAKSLDQTSFKTPENKHVEKKSVQLPGKFGLKEETLPPKSRALVHELNSGLFLKFLERLTGIVGLLPDPYLAEGGYHVSRDRGFLNVHADFSHHDFLGLERRLNLLLYFNEDWRPEYGGHLGLYNKRLELCKSISPDANRVAIFTTSEDSFHGFPERMTLPRGTSRISLALYYYSLPRKEREKKKILFPDDPDFIHEVTPNK